VVNASEYFPPPGGISVEKNKRVESPDTIDHPSKEGDPKNSKDEFVRRLPLSDVAVGPDFEHPTTRPIKEKENSV
jgi:hypothetical protein